MQLILVRNIDDSNIGLTSICDNSKSIWDKLLFVYEQRSGQRFNQLMKHFFALTEKDPNEDIATHIAKMKKNFSELNDELKHVAKTAFANLFLMSRITSTLPQ